MGLFSKIATIGGVVAFARSQKGQELIGKAKTYANDPATRRKVSDLKDRYLGNRGGQTPA